MDLYKLYEMKKIVIPIDYAGISPGVIAYLAAFSRDFPVNEIILIKSFHRSSVAEKTFTFPGIVGIVNEEASLNWKTEEAALKTVAKEMTRVLPLNMQVYARMVEGSLEKAIETMIEAERPDLLIIVNDAKSAVSDRAGSIVPIGRISPVTLLLLPFTAVTNLSVGAIF